MRIDAIFGAIGRFAVRFRWPLLAAWIVAPIAAATQLPSLASVTQSNNSRFLPASAPSSHAPSTVVLLGRWNWWPSGMSRASARVVASEPEDMPAASLDDQAARESRQPHPLP